MVDAFDISANKARAAILTAGTSSSPSSSYLTDNMASLKSRIEDIDTSEMTGKVTMSSIIDAINNSFESRQDTDVPQVAILLTDTENIEVDSDISDELDSLRESTTFIGIGVGPSVDRPLLEEFATAEPYIVPDFEDLGSEEMFMEIADDATPGN